jgi:hypothetical protein
MNKKSRNSFDNLKIPDDEFIVQRKVLFVLLFKRKQRALDKELPGGDSKLESRCALPPVPAVSSPPLRRGSPPNQLPCWKFVQGADPSFVVAAIDSALPARLFSG